MGYQLLSASEQVWFWIEFDLKSVLSRFEDTIVGQFFGHTHTEIYSLTFEDPNDSTSRPTSVIYSAPSLTTYTDFNPAYRIYTIDGERRGSTYKVIDWEGRTRNMRTVNKFFEVEQGVSQSIKSVQRY